MGLGRHTVYVYCKHFYVTSEIFVYGMTVGVIPLQVPIQYVVVMHVFSSD